MESIFDIKKLLNVLLKWKKQLIIVFIASSVLSIAYSYLIREKFKSSAVIYPVNTKPYDTETAVEQMLQVLEANDIRDSVINKFNLLQHYDIDSSENKHYYTDAALEFSENISFTKTKYESVEITVLDYSADTALLIANSIIYFYNKKVKGINNASLVEVANTAKSRMIEKKMELDTLEQKMKKLRVNYGILDYENQIRYLGESKNVTSDLNSPGTDAASTSIIQNLRQQGGEFIRLRNDIDQARQVYNATKHEYEVTLRELNRDISYTQLIVKPFKADKKAYPIRWVIVLISVAASMILALTVISFYEQSKVTK